MIIKNVSQISNCLKCFECCSGDITDNGRFNVISCRKKQQQRGFFDRNESERHDSDFF